MSEQIVISRSTTNELVITNKNRKNKHLMFDALINQWVRELNAKNLRVVAFSPTIFPARSGHDKNRFAVTFICENVSLQR